MLPKEAEVRIRTVLVVPAMVALKFPRKNCVRASRINKARKRRGRDKKEAHCCGLEPTCALPAMNGVLVTRLSKDIYFPQSNEIRVA